MCYVKELAFLKTLDNLRMGFPGGTVEKKPPANAGGAKDVGERFRFDPWAGKIPWSRKWRYIPVFFPCKFHGQRHVTGYSPWGPKESDTTERLSVHTQPKDGAWLPGESTM